MGIEPGRSKPPADCLMPLALTLGHAENLEDFGNQHGMEVFLFHVVGSFVGLVTVSAEMLGPFGDIDDTERHIAVFSSEECEEIVLAAGRRGTGHYALVHPTVM